MGRQIIRGEHGPVQLRRGAAGVPRITANSLTDALQGLGWCHARDRGLQMLLFRILGRGQASEHLRASEEHLRFDRFFRSLGLLRDLAGETAALTPLARSALDAYCRGVGRYFARHAVPWELRWLGYRLDQDPWTIADVFLMGKMLGYLSLAQSQAEMERFVVACVQGGVPRPQLEELFPGQLGGLDEALVRQVRLQRPFVPRDLPWPAVLPRGANSNNWALAGAKTASGRPFLCNDPHLEVNRIPPVFYEAVLRWHTRAGPRYAMGATVPGLPGVALGRTNDLAWANTYAAMDTIDAWIEDCRAGQYRRGDGWAPFAVRQESIRRKGQEPVEVSFHENEHGVLEGDPRQPGYYLAWRWSCNEGTAALAMDAILRLLEARTVEEGRPLLARVGNSGWNWVLADRAGNIGYQMAGQAPRRRQGVSGLVPLPGWDPANDWQGFVPWEDLPRASNPPEGFLVTANDDLNHLGKVGPINLPIAPYRAQRIRQVLSRTQAFTLEEMQQLQLDVHSLQAERFMELVKPLLPRFEPEHAEAVRILKEWDCRYTAESVGATLFERFYRALIEQVFGADQAPGFGPAVIRHLWEATGVLVGCFGNFDRVMLAERSAWFGRRTREELYGAALKKALSGPPAPYGQERQVLVRHVLFGGKLPRWLGFDRGPISLIGSRATVNQGQIAHPGGRETTFAAAYRFVTDLGADELHTNLPGGPSDRRLSKWYAGGLREWVAGEYKRMSGLVD
jgi:penicillin amidase